MARHPVPYGFRAGEEGALEPVPEQQATVSAVPASCGPLEPRCGASKRRWSGELGARVGLAALGRLVRLVAEAFPPPSPEMKAVNAYRARFGDTPWMIHIPPDLMPAWLEAIHNAVRTGRPLIEADLRRVVGFGYPPPGAHT